ncbi:hypothetical protein EDC04DRAFT_3149942 [Pisolithus marmoratus]|nr:hypothetical protein EDC04DRAFT_3149942 [Pisolithus marmoratus]
MAGRKAKANSHPEVIPAVPKRSPSPAKVTPILEITAEPKLRRSEPATLMSRLGTTKAGQSLSSGILTPTVAARVMRGGVLRGGSGTRASSETGEWAYTLNLDNLKTQDLFMSTHNEEDLYLASTHIELRGMFDGRWIVSGDNEKKAIVWDAATHKQVHEFADHASEVYGVDISSDSTTIASVDASTIQIFSTTSGDRLLPPLSHDNVCGVKFSPDGSRLATTSWDGFRIYNTHNGEILFDSGGKGSVGSWQDSLLAWSRDGQTLFVATSGGKIICFNVAESSSSEWSMHETQSQTSVVTNGKFIACSGGSSVLLWDCISHRQIGSIIPHTSEIDCVALSPSGRYLACGLKLQGGKISIHDLGDVLPPEYFYPCFPLIQVSGETLKSWTQDDPTNTEILLSEEITSASSPSHYVLANRALIRARLTHWEPAIEDAKESLRAQPSPIGHIAMAVALLGKGDRVGALCTFDLVFHDCEPRDNRFLLLLKLILVFESGDQEEALTRVEYLVTRAKNDDDDDATYLYTWVLGAMYAKKENYEPVMPLLERAMNLAPSDKRCLPLKTISLIFGWSFNGLDIVAQQRQCESFHTEGRTAEAVEVLLNILRHQSGKRSGAGQLLSGSQISPKNAYSDVPLLNPPSAASLLIKRSRAQAAKGSWDSALQDANDAVKADFSCPWGYEAKCVALHGAKRYAEAIEAFKFMLQVIEQSHDPAVRRLRKNYISPDETVARINSTVIEILKSCPLVVIDVNTGRLCNGSEWRRVFEASSTFADLVLSMTKELDVERIRREVAFFFRYVMLSHVWQGKEPLFQDVECVWDLPDTASNKKLRDFCKETRRLGYNWAWSDTCCIDQNTSTILNQSLTSMYKWYADSAATLVFLTGVAHPSKPGDLTRSVWMTRGWTLQELLAPKVILFYDSEWKPYLGDPGPNHKQSQGIMQELAAAIEISLGTIVKFSPDNLGVRAKLRLASTRKVTREEDVAYSLIGIFKSDIRPHYGEGADDALGHLLEEIVARSGEDTVLAWSGQSSSYNSCLPASISIYSQTPHIPPLLEGEEMDICVTELRGNLSQQVALGIYNQISLLPPARFAARRLHLPCIVFSVSKLNIQGPSGSNKKLYRARASGVGYVEFTTADDLLVHRPQRFVFALPWIGHIRGPNDEVAWGGQFESDTDSDSESDCDGGSDDTPLSPSDAEVDDYTQALRMVARLRQPFSALLLLQQLHGEYKRVAAENEIIISGVGPDITSKSIRAKVLEIL